MSLVFHRPGHSFGKVLPSKLVHWGWAISSTWLIPPGTCLNPGVSPDSRFLHVWAAMGTARKGRGGWVLVLFTLQ